MAGPLSSVFPGICPGQSVMSDRLGQAQPRGAWTPHALDQEGMRCSTGKTTPRQVRRVKGGSLNRRNHGAQVRVHADLLPWDY